MLVDQALQRGSDRRPIRVDKTKSRTSRTIRLSDPVVVALKRQKVIQAADRLAAGPGYSKAWVGHVFLNEIGRPLNPSNVRRVFAAICRRADVLALTPYECRYSTASLAAAAGMDPWEVVDLLGHRDPRMLERHYRHKLSKVAEGAADVSALLPGRRRKA
jgi:integrase